MDIDAADVAGQLAAESVDPDRLPWVEIFVGVIDPQLVSFIASSNGITAASS